MNNLVKVNSVNIDNKEIIELTGIEKEEILDQIYNIDKKLTGFYTDGIISYNVSSSQNVYMIW
jgi:hypothetical protein